MQHADGGSRRGNWEPGPAQTHSPRTRDTPSCSSTAKNLSSSSSSSREAPVPCTSDQPDSKVSSEAREGSAPWADSTPTNFPVGTEGGITRAVGYHPGSASTPPHTPPYTYPALSLSPVSCFSSLFWFDSWLGNGR